MSPQADCDTHLDQLHAQTHMTTTTASQSIAPRQLKAWLGDAHELALLDVREHGQYGEGHLFFAVPLPYSVLELGIPRLVPRKTTRIVVYGDTQTQTAVELAASKLLELGYTRVFLLQDGIEAWKAAGYTTFAGVNLPSKTFGELAEHAYQTPSLPARRLYEMLNDKDSNVLVLDGRPIQEYQKMNIPGSYCCPNGELALRAQALAPDPNTTIVINCAGRTRSIIGAQTLIHLGMPNPVYALENGTQGWHLADLPLEHGSRRLYPPEISASLRPTLRERAQRLVKKFHIPSATAHQVLQWLKEGDRSLFLCDIRTEEEHAASALPSLIQHAPGGQLIQATDQYVGVRKAKIVLCDFDGIRAPAVASWLKQLGWDVCLLTDPEALVAAAGHAGPSLDRPAASLPPLPHTRTIAADALASWMHDHPAAQILDARPSAAYRACCLKESTWVIRPTLLAHADPSPAAELLILGTSLPTLQLLAGDLERAGHQHVTLCVIGPTELVDSGLPTMTDGNGLPDSACIDFLFFAHDRHHGNKAAARQYLAWETGLAAQIDAQERDTFSLDTRHR